MTRAVQRDQMPLHFSGTYRPEDVHILLTPAHITPVDVAQKEALIQSGARHYSEMLSPEQVPDARYMELYRDALARNAGRLKADIGRLAEAIAARPATARTCVVISLARAGTPIGVLLKRALVRRGVTAHHYSISIIRGRGIDEVALDFIKARHGVETAVFVDGWTGKGAITAELERALSDGRTGFAPVLAVIADPAGCAHLAATIDDYVIPSGLLNGIVSGLISRSVLNADHVGPGDFHACLFQDQHRPHDLSRAFIDAIEGAAPCNGPGDWSPQQAAMAKADSRALLADLMAAEGVDDVNRIKPGIAESTRAILRRVPHAVYLRDGDDPDVRHIVHLAGRAGVPIIRRDLYNYRAVTIIRKLGGEQE